MIKRIFRICLTVTVISLVVTLVLLPFGVRSMMDTVNQWAEYASYEVEYEQPAEGITQVNVKFTGRDWITCAVEQQSSGKDIVLAGSGIQFYDVTTTSEVEDGVLNLTVDLAPKEEFRKVSAVAQQFSGLFQTELRVPVGIPVTFDESSCQVTSYTTQSDFTWVMNGFYDYAQEPIARYSMIREPLYQYAVGSYTRAEFDAAFDRAAADLLADINDTVRNSETAAESRQPQSYGTTEYSDDAILSGEEDVVPHPDTDSGLRYGERPLPENTGTLAQAYLDAVREYLALSVDCWCSMNSTAIPTLKTVTTPLETLRAQRTAAQEAVTEARRALADAVDGCIYHEYIYDALQLS